MKLTMCPFLNVLRSLISKFDEYGALKLRSHGLESFPETGYCLCLSVLSCDVRRLALTSRQQQ